MHPMQGQVNDPWSGAEWLRLALGAPHGEVEPSQ